MAKKKNNVQNTTSIESRSFSKGMIKDLNESLMGEGTYLHARNAINNTVVGDMGVLSNEPSNDFCTSAPYPIIGVIHLFADEWVIFSTDDTNSEIGFFKEGRCEYSTVVNDQCLNFKRSNLIIGESKENFDCTWQVYWADNLNPDRTMNIQNVPYIQNCTTLNDCTTCVDTTDLDCDKIRIAKLTTPPCITLETSLNGGELLNGTYQAVIAYTENEIRVTDYSSPSIPISLFNHDNVNGSIDVVIGDIDERYEEFELVILSFVNQQLVATRIGIYSTRQKRIAIDKIDATLTSIPLSFIPLNRPAYEKSEGIYRNGEYLLRVAPTSKFEFNYQLLANQITTEWVGVEYPSDYYRKGGKNVGYLRDEVYSLFIRWIYNTYEKTNCYHIPGRPPVAGETNTVASPAYTTGLFFEENNTATILPASGTTDDGGIIISRGKMAYWESSEIYPDNRPDVWGNLCGKKIRHHKFPDNAIINHFNSVNENIVVLGLQFKNIQYPVDNLGNPIPNIIGYEILRGTREGNKSIVAKGLINNMGSYNREDNGELAFYPNYPYNDLRQDRFLSNQFINGDNPNGIATALGGSRYSQRHLTFHSPDTNFKNPFLSAKELKIYETLHGPTSGQFIEPYLHPSHKIITDFAFFLSAIVGFGIAIKATQGEKKTVQGRPFTAESQWAGTTTNTAALSAFTSSAADAAISAAIIAETATGAAKLGSIASFSALVGDMSAENAAIITANTTAGLVPGVSNISYYEWDTEGKTGLPGILRMAQAMPTFLAFWGEGTNSFINVIKAFSKYRQFALAYQSHCFYKNKNLAFANTKVKIENSGYLKDRIQNLDDFTINNLYRSSSVALLTEQVVPNPAVTDTSRRLASEVYLPPNDLVVNQLNTVGVASSHYVGLKQRLRNQYGQINGIRKIVISPCMQKFELDPLNPPGATSDIIFGGDIYIGRYTEKNTFFFFQDWMYDLPDGFEYDYRLRKMMPFPTYWMDTKDFQVSDFFQNIYDSILSGSGSPGPNGFHNFDHVVGSALGGGEFDLSLVVKRKHMYLFNSGVRDFFVESEVNVEYRDWDDTESRRHYDPYRHTSLTDLFRTDIIKSGNFYKYDYSLSTSRFYQSYPDMGSVQERNYDPIVAETCYTYYPNRVIYSLPQSRELKLDNWLTYLVNNYKDFTSKITAVKTVGKSGAMFLFENEAPLQIAGVDTLETSAGTKITIGDGGLFNQPLQNIVNTDKSYEYGSCQNRLSVINTPGGLFWISQNQGKIFAYTGQLEEISQNGMKWWFEEFGSYKLTEDFPDYDLTDNPIVGIGCQSIYDNSNTIVYFAKRDFKIRDYYKRLTTYIGNNQFSIAGAIVTLGNPTYFEDASWTISYDPKTKTWISFHDWHPNLMIPSKNNFLTVKNNNIWRHNDRSDSFCNFYGENFPFDIELAIPSGVNVNTLRNIEYYMEVYRWDNEGVDKHHVLDFNFDRAIVYNTEQVSGELRLNLQPKNNPFAMNQYPVITPSGIEILYSKEEQKYRFNQFWDITDDRGEFTTAQRLMWTTESNGYIKTLNPLNINYNKELLQRKKFRHYLVNLYLRRRVSGPNNMLVKVILTKNQQSQR